MILPPSFSSVDVPGIVRSMPYDRWRELSDHGRRISRLVTCGPDEVVVGAGFTHPRGKARDEFVAAQLDAMGPEAAAEYLQRR